MSALGMDTADGHRRHSLNCVRSIGRLDPQVVTSARQRPRVDTIDYPCPPGLSVGPPPSFLHPREQGARFPRRID